jgi:hypothetical protein
MVYIAQSMTLKCFVSNSEIWFDICEYTVDNHFFNTVKHGQYAHVSAHTKKNIHLDTTCITHILSSETGTHAHNLHILQYPGLIPQTPKHHCTPPNLLRVVFVYR